MPQKLLKLFLGNFILGSVFLLIWGFCVNWEKPPWLSCCLIIDDMV